MSQKEDLTAREAEVIRILKVLGVRSGMNLREIIC